MNRKYEFKIFEAQSHMGTCEFIEALNVTRPTYYAIKNGETDGMIRFWKRLQELTGITDSEVWALIKNEDNTN